MNESALLCRGKKCFWTKAIRRRNDVLVQMNELRRPSSCAKILVAFLHKKSYESIRLWLIQWKIKTGYITFLTKRIMMKLKCHPASEANS